MTKQYDTLETVHLNAGSDYLHPPEPPIVLHLEDPAMEAFTDFQHVKAITIDPTSTINEALIEMKVCGVHMLLVIDQQEKVVGMISSEDILGEKPVKIIQERRIPRNNITVKMVMTQQQNIIAFNRHELRHAKVGHVIETMHKLKQHYALVLDINSAAQQQTVRGIFSSHCISKQLGSDVTSDLGNLKSIAELNHDLD